ncbi:MAG: histidine kinase [Mangrovibacterium sp.]
MSKLNFKPGLLVFLLIFRVCMPVKADNPDHSSFLFNCELYEKGMNHFEGTKYLNLSFLITPQKSQGKQVYTAHLKKAMVSTNYPFGYKKISRYYESGDPVNPELPGYIEIAVRFLERNPVRFSFKTGQLMLNNRDSLKTAFDKEVKIYYPGPTKRPLGYNDAFFRFDRFLNIFSNIQQDLPDDLKIPGDLSLKNGVVYNYLNDFNHLQHIEITDSRNHTKSTVYVKPDSKRIRYKKEQSLRLQTIIRTTEAGERNSIRMEGFMPNERDKTLQFIVEGASPLDPAQKIRIKADPSGKFSLLLDQDFPVTITSSSGHRFYAEPGDDFSVTANLKGDSLFFAGIGAENNRFIQEEARLEKFPKMNFHVRNMQTQAAWFRKADQSTNACFALLEIYQNDLTPRFYETQYLNYYFGKINWKLDYIFGYVEPDKSGIRKREYTGLDTIPTQYQSFVYNREFNKFLENNFILQFEKLRDFTYAMNFDTNEVPTLPELLRLAALSYSGKILRDYFEFAVQRIDQSGNTDDKRALKNLIQEYFDNTHFQTKVLQLLEKASLLEIGSPFPDARFKDLNGNDVSFKQYKGKLIYLMFWRNDALVLDKQWDEYQQLIKTLDTENVRFVNVGMEEDFDKWEKYVETMQLKGINLFIDRNSEDFRTNFSRLKSRHFLLVDGTGAIVNNNGPDPSVASILISQNLGSSGKEKFLTAVLFCFLAILVIFGLVWIISRTRQKRKAKIETLLNRLRETELKAIKAQMNPHFLFNSLNSIQNLINQQKVEAANMYLSKFARLLHSVLQHSEKEFIPLAAELETLDLYIQLEKLRFNFDYQLRVDPAIDIHNSYIPPLLLQPFIENAILHGLQPKQGGKKLDINIEEEDKQLVCNIEDNGVGRNLSQMEKTDHHGMGNKLSIERIHLLNQKNDSNFKLSIHDGQPGTGGTRVTISFTNNLI